MLRGMDTITPTAPQDAVQARQWVLDGRVQGVGFRPFVYRLATGCRLTGQVRNSGAQVIVEAQGTPDKLDRFEHALLSEAPGIARPHLAAVRSIAVGVVPSGFKIQTSTIAPAESPQIALDMPICADCLAEMNAPGNRRFRYPFTHCDQCGPRFTIIECLPYDRARTSLKDFPLCSDCDREYHDPTDRRFHAQTIACPNCGPKLRWRHLAGETVSTNHDALSAAVSALSHGEILAVKGIGGYHLMVDATDDEAVARLRQRKHRPHKPFAVMFPWQGHDGLTAIRQTAAVDIDEADLLASDERPVVILPLHKQHDISTFVAPGLNQVGALLPATPIHHLLLQALGRPLIATSANISGDPIVTDPDDAERQLSDIADAFLHHDRTIRHRADDSVYRSINGKVRPVRLGRGSTPLDIALPWPLAHPVLSVGAQQKNTISLAWGNRLVISPHVGDLSHFRTQQNFTNQIRSLSDLYDIEPEIVIHDLHGDYHATRWARDADQVRYPVGHHVAHASALSGEHGRLDEDILVFTWDGTGLGLDGTLWGGEALIGRPGHWTRLCSFEPFPLPGGEAAIQSPWRLAATLCWASGVDWQPEHITDVDMALLHTVWTRRLNCPSSSSVGRLFDVAAALLGLVDSISFEAQGPMLLEALLVRQPCTGHAITLAHRQDDQGIWRCAWHPLIRHLADSTLLPAQRAADFHATLVDVLCRQARLVRKLHPFRHIGLTGGVFQNRPLTEAAVAALSADGFEVLLHERIPCNDAGISFGQVMEMLPTLRRPEVA